MLPFAGSCTAPDQSIPRLPASYRIRQIAISPCRNYVFLLHAIASRRQNCPVQGPAPSPGRLIFISPYSRIRRCPLRFRSICQLTPVQHPVSAQTRSARSDLRPDKDCNLHRLTFFTHLPALFFVLYFRIHSRCSSWHFLQRTIHSSYDPEYSLKRQSTSPSLPTKRPHLKQLNRKGFFGIVIFLLDSTRLHIATGAEDILWLMQPAHRATLFPFGLALLRGQWQFGFYGAAATGINDGRSIHLHFNSFHK